MCIALALIALAEGVALIITLRVIARRAPTQPQPLPNNRLKGWL